jgi:hypothetical protein
MMCKTVITIYSGLREEDKKCGYSREFRAKGFVEAETKKKKKNITSIDGKER